jgi:hypothetical protein
MPVDVEQASISLTVQPAVVPRSLLSLLSFIPGSQDVALF